MGMKRILAALVLLAGGCTTGPIAMSGVPPAQRAACAYEARLASVNTTGPQTPSAAYQQVFDDCAKAALADRVEAEPADPPVRHRAPGSPMPAWCADPSVTNPYLRVEC